MNVVVTLPTPNRNTFICARIVSNCQFFSPRGAGAEPEECVRVKTIWGAKVQKKGIYKYMPVNVTKKSKMQS